MENKKPILLRKKTTSYFFGILLILTTLIFFRILLPFWATIIMAVLLVHYFRPLYLFLCNRWKFPCSVASIFITLMLVISIFVPLLFFWIVLSNQAGESYSMLRENWPLISKVIEHFDVKDNVLNLMSRFSFLKPLEEQVAEADFAAVFYQYLNNFTQMVINRSTQTFINATVVVFNFFIMLYMMYYLFVDGTSLFKEIKTIIPLPRDDTDMFVGEVIKITDATMLGTIFIGVLEGTFGGILFWISNANMGSPIIWGIIVMVFSVLPVLGANSVFVPVAIYQIIIGQYYSASLLLLVGFPCIVFSQAVVKAKLVGNHSGLHPAIIVLSTLGGIAWLGVLGFLLGPLFASLFVAVWRLFERRYSN